MYRHDVMFKSFAHWLFQPLCYKWNISFYKDNWLGWLDDNLVYLIDNIECKYKDWNAYFKLALEDQNISYFNVSEKPLGLHRH